jgi:SWI/SNF-related matrix-associated actin-dependent regulator of chromatin subfamily A protein 2/4
LEDSEAALPQSDALKNEISKESPLEDDEDLMDSDHNDDSSDLLEGQRQYNSTIHSIQEKVDIREYFIIIFSYIGNS